MRGTRAGRRLLLAGVAALATLALARARLAARPFADGLFFWVFAAQAAAYVAALRAEARLEPRERGAALVAILALAIGFRALLLPVPAFLTTDLERYRYDGALVAAGANPYLRAPADALAEGAPLPPHARVHSIYPPLAQVTFALAARAGGSDLAFKALAVAGDLAALGAWLWLAPRTGWRATRCVVWAWHPMVLWAFAGSGHVDALAIALMLLALRALVGGRRGLAGAVLGAAAAVKLAPLALVPAWGRELGRAAWLAPAVLLVAYAPFAGAGAGVAAGAEVYLRHWEHMGLVYEPVARLWRPGAARALCVAGWALCLGWAACSRRPVVERTGGLVAGALLLTPTLHPWYVCWVVPLCERVSGLPILTLSLSAVWGYGPLLGRPEWGSWGQTGWYWYFTWVPVAVACTAAHRSRLQELIDDADASPRS